MRFRTPSHTAPHQRGALTRSQGSSRRSLWEGIIIALVGAVLGIFGSVVAIPAIDGWIHPPQEDKIRQVIEQEAALVVGKDMDQAVTLFAEGAIVRNAAGGNTQLEERWVGQAQIEQRYEGLPEFVYLRHDAIQVSVSSDQKYARVVADTVGQYREGVGTVDISGDTGEKWTLERINDEWKITSFTYGLY